MKFGDYRQQICFTFFVVSTIVSLLCDYIWAYHFAPNDIKFPSPWSVFEFSARTSVVVVSVTTALFAIPLCIVKAFATHLPTASDHAIATGIAACVQLLVFVSPHVTDRFNPVLGILVTVPLVAGFIFAVTRRPSEGANTKLS
jgi:ABC-type nitrate/sulfonate/bicarbonate transport system permease component